MSGRVFLSGGGSAKQTFDLDEVFLQDLKKILYIPLAWPNDDFDSCLRWFNSTMELHRKKVKVDMLTDLSRKVELKDYDAVYIGGGNTFKLLKKIKDSKFDVKLIEYYKNGGTVYGGSAGAIIWGRNIDIARICADADVNLVGLKNTSGFDILDGIDVQCHYSNSQSDEHKEYVKRSGRRVIAIPEDSALVVEGNKLRVIGIEPISLITENAVKLFNVRQEFILSQLNNTKKKVT